MPIVSCFQAAARLGTYNPSAAALDGLHPSDEGDQGTDCSQWP